MPKKPKSAAKRRAAPPAVVHDPLPPQVRPGPEGGKRQQNRLRRLAELRAAGLALFLERGIESVTIDDIVGRAKMAKGSFYRYFADKESLVAAILAPLNERMTRAVERCASAVAAAGDPQALVAAYQALAIDIVGLMALRPEVRLYLQESRAPAVGARQPVAALADYLEARTVELTRVAQGQGLLRADLDPRISALAVIGAAERLFVDYLDADIDPSASAAAAFAFISLVLDGIRR